MAAVTIPFALRRRTSRRRSVFDYLSMGAVTMALFVAGLLVFERVTDTPLVSRIFEGTIAARTRADYSVTFSPRVRPVRSTVTQAPTATPGASR